MNRDEKFSLLSGENLPLLFSKSTKEIYNMQLPWHSMNMLSPPPPTHSVYGQAFPHWEGTPYLPPGVALGSTVGQALGTVSNTQQ